MLFSYLNCYSLLLPASQLSLNIYFVFKPENCLVSWLPCITSHKLATGSAICEWCLDPFFLSLMFMLKLGDHFFSIHSDFISSVFREQRIL